MTIDEVMALAESVMATAGDVARGWVPVQHLTEREEVLRAAILALLDATRSEALENCIDVCRVHATDNGTAQKIANDINGWRIAARKGGNDGR
jgi:hypothetical protein